MASADGEHIVWQGNQIASKLRQAGGWAAQAMVPESALSQLIEHLTWLCCRSIAWLDLQERRGGKRNHIASFRSPAASRLSQHDQVIHTMLVMGAGGAS